MNLTSLGSRNSREALSCQPLALRGSARLAGDGCFEGWWISGESRFFSTRLVKLLRAWGGVQRSCPYRRPDGHPAAACWAVRFLHGLGWTWNHWVFVYGCLSHYLHCKVGLDKQWVVPEEWSWMLWTTNVHDMHSCSKQMFVYVFCNFFYNNKGMCRDTLLSLPACNLSIGAGMDTLIPTIEYP